MLINLLFHETTFLTLAGCGEFCLPYADNFEVERQIIPSESNCFPEQIILKRKYHEKVPIDTAFLAITPLL